MSSLDDFFAKKDRKKSKGKKFATADEIAKKLEETGKKSEKIKKDKTQSSQAGGQEVDEQGNTIQDEDEWRDFEEEKKDYTGLKIHNLTIGEEETEGTNSGGEGDEDGGLEENEAGEMVPKRKQGPWRVVHSEEQPTPQPAAQPSPPPQNDAVAPVEQKTSGSYVPPALRNQTQSSIGHHNPRYSNRHKAAPDVRNEELFPSLSAANTQEVVKKKREDGSGGGGYGGNSGGGGGGGFEEVRNSKSHTARYEPPMMRASANRLQLGNKFGALNHDRES